MGMYTEFVFGCQLKKDIPQETINILKYIVYPKTKEPTKLPDHPFFKCNGWDMVAACSSYYFGYTHSLSCLRYDDIDKHWQIAIRSSLKNYNNEIKKFIDWMQPYISEGSGWPREFLGYSIYEEDEHPQLYYLKEKLGKCTMII